MCVNRKSSESVFFKSGFMEIPLPGATGYGAVPARFGLGRSLRDAPRGGKIMCIYLP